MRTALARSLPHMTLERAHTVVCLPAYVTRKIDERPRRPRRYRYLYQAYVHPPLPASNSRPASPPKLPGHSPWFCFVGKRGRSAAVRTADHLAPYAERLGALTPKPEADRFLARQQKHSLAIRASSHEGEQRLFRSVQLSTDRKSVV